jgi:hypothetical protein
MAYVLNILIKLQADQSDQPALILGYSLEFCANSRCMQFGCMFFFHHS